MEIFVPANDEERIHTRFTPHVHQFYERFVYKNMVNIILCIICILEQPKLIFNNPNIYIHITV
jgi:hypothetical protein